MKKILLLFTYIAVGLLYFSCGTSHQNNRIALQPVTLSYCTNGGLSADELMLAEMIHTYRKSKGLKKISLSKSLTYVAQQHARDLQHYKVVEDKKCNIHSWSANGIWKGCCYTPDHRQAACMTKKPAEMTDYKGRGYEISYYYSQGATPERALKGWQKSTGHNNVLLNKDKWENTEWNAMGIGIYGNYATVWFGKEKDAAGVPPACNR
jgi:uncharacterized protein YkwD